MKFLSNQMVLGLTLLTVIVFGRVVTFEFVNYDDPFYVHNIYVVQGLTLEGLRFAFGFEESHYGPLMWLSYMLDAGLFGNNPGGYHLTNLIIHLLSTLLFFHIVTRMTGARRTAFFAAILFAIHPLRVETVAWVADRKDLLAMVFSLAALEFYRRFVVSRKLSDYVLTSVLFVMSLLSKPVLVTFPFALLLLDYWPLNRMQDHLGSWKKGTAGFLKLFVEKIPLIVITAAFTVWTYSNLVQANQIMPEEARPLMGRLAYVPINYLQHLSHVFWPSDLVVLYPLESAQPPLGQAAGSFLVLLGISLISVWQFRKRPYLFVGWFWFLGTLVPMIGFLLPVGPSPVADKYTYFPLIGLIFVVAWGLREWALSGRAVSWMPTAVSVGIAVALILVSVQQIGVWKNSITLFRHAEQYFPRHFLVQTNLGHALTVSGDLEGGIAHFKTAIQIAPDHLLSWMNLGTSYRRLERPREAVAAYLECVRIEPDNVVAHYYLGKLYHQLEDGPNAVRYTRRALELLKVHYGENFDKTLETRDNLKNYRKIYNLPDEKE